MLESNTESDHSTLHTHTNNQVISKLIIYQSLQESRYSFLCCDFNSKDTQQGFELHLNLEDKNNPNLLESSNNNLLQ